MLTKSDEVLSVQLYESLTHKRRVVGSIILQKRSLKLFFVVVCRDVHGLHGEWVEPRSEHYRRRSSGCWIVVLNLLGRIVVTLKAKRKLQGVGERRAGVARHKVGNEVLLLADLLRELEIFFSEFLIHGKIGLARRCGYSFFQTACS